MIRPYEARDFEDCLYLQEICYLKPCTENVLREKIAGGRCWVFEDSPLVVGCLITEFQKSPEHKHPGKVFIWSVTVAENWRRRGIATGLLQAATEYYADIPLWLYTEPNSPGNHLYTKLGYTASKIERDWYGQGLDAVLMVKR